MLVAVSLVVGLSYAVEGEVDLETAETRHIRLKPKRVLYRPQKPIVVYPVYTGECHGDSLRYQLPA